MKILIVAHPDDEILFFNPEEFDKIIIVFSDRPDREVFNNNRINALAEHPLKDKIECLNFVESDLWTKPENNESKKIHKENFEKLCEILKKIEADEITTHNAYGEYGHYDHILVHDAVMESACCQVNGKNPATYRIIKSVYKKYNVWTAQSK